ncbi:caspase family protein [Reichenbachiella sp. MALMAid0571]|uniref:caspase family protein n=1 Tax=Reichenbachiella sp. MALMAid0571 TaxID=3143939 RepID=UPI0032DF8315
MNYKILLLVILLLTSPKVFAQKNWLEGKNERRTAASLKGALSYTEVSPDGRHIAKAYGVMNLAGKNAGSDIQIFDAQRLKLTKVLTGHSDFISGLKFTPDGKYLLSISRDRKMIKWNIKTGQKIAEQEGERGLPFSLDMNSDGSLIALTVLRSLIPYAVIMKTSDFSLVKSFKLRPTVDINSIKFYKDRYLVVGRHNVSYDYKLNVYDYTTGKEVFHDVWRPFLLPPSNDINSKFLLVTNRCAAQLLTPTILNMEVVEFDENKGKPVATDFKITEKIGWDSTDKINYTPTDVLAGENRIFVATLKHLNVYDGQGNFLKSIQLIANNLRSLDMKIADMSFLNDEKHMIITDNRNVSHIIDAQEVKKVATLYASLENSHSYVLITPDGKTEGSIDAAEDIYWTNGVRRIPVAATFDKMYTPNLGETVFNQQNGESEEDIERMIANAPSIEIVSDDSVFYSKRNEITVTVKVRENGDPVSKVRIFVNDKLVNENTRGFKMASDTFVSSVNVIPGQNIIKAVAISDSGYQSDHDQIVVNYKADQLESDLYILAVGINQYKNPKYNLNYAIADATAFTDHFLSKSIEIFQDAELIFIKDQEANKGNVVAAFEKIATKAKPNDVFVFYYAGHGMMDESEFENEFFLGLHDITQLYGQSEMYREKGISAEELKQYCSKIAAQKQVVILDACQSGGAVETFAKRGVASEKAMLQLARSAGTVLLASTGSEQYATEFSELGHGVFTYALIEGMAGKADGSNDDKKVTIKELESYLNDRIPELTELHKGTVQYPMSWSRGQDFPMVIVK